MKHAHNFIDRTGEKHKNKAGEIATIINYRSSLDIDIQFIDGIILKNMQYHNIKKGVFKNPQTPSILGVGFIVGMVTMGLPLSFVLDNNVVESKELIKPQIKLELYNNKVDTVFVYQVK